jgi:hypothetical protein
MTAEPISMQDLVTMTLLGDKMLTTTLYPEHADKQAVEPVALSPVVREVINMVTEGDGDLSEQGGKANHHCTIRGTTSICE